MWPAWRKKLELIVLGAAVVGASLSLTVFSGNGSPTTGTAVLAKGIGNTTTSTTEAPTTTTAPEPPPTTEAPAPAPAAPAAPAPAPAPAQNQSAPAPAPAPPPPPPAPPAFSPGPAGLGGAMQSLTNGDRAANGLPALGWSGQLGGIAQNWANWMAQNQSLTHQDLNGVIGGTSFTTMGENILSGPGNMGADSMEQVFMGSPDHRANILRSTFSVIGVGAAYSADGRVWVAVEFGG
jgi:uncharacterized protein YkwD